MIYISETDTLKDIEVTLFTLLKQERDTGHRGGPGWIPGQSMWDLWWTKWHWDRFFPEYFGFPLSIAFHRCSITWKIEKN
jgi:hypothetical protein